MEVELDQDLLYTAIQFHGPNLHEALRSELGEVGDLTGLSTISFPAYANGHSITNDLDNEKQLKLHKFIANNSRAFFSVDLLANNKQKQCEDFEINSFTVMPPYEVFGYVNKETKLKHFLNELSEGEIIITSISSKTVSGLILKVLCTYTEPIRCVSDINVRGFCQASIPGLSIGDNLCCEVLEVVPEACKLVCGIKGVKCHKKYKDLLGLFNMENCPQTFKLFHAGKNGESYNSMLQNSTGFKNPSNTCNLELITGLSDDRYSILPALSGSFPEKEIALELRKVQSAQWAIQSVSDGIKFFKAGQHSEAFLCLNKALTIDSLNVEAYVARGALYANLSRFQKAIEDLKSALKINPKHVNGRKYLGETLMGYARTLESQNKLEEALQYYEECLQVIPDHDEAKASIEYLKSTLLVGRAIPINTFDSLPKKKNDTDLEKSASSSSSSNNSNSSSTDSSSSGSSSDDESISSSDSDSDHTSSSDSSSDGSSGNDSQKIEKERSLSPFSKRLAMMDGSSTNGGGLPCNPSFIATDHSQSQLLNSEKESDIEGRIQKLLLLSQSNKIKKSKQIGINIQKLLQDAYALKNEEKKTDKKMKKSKDKKKSHKHKKKDSKNKQKSAKDHQEHHHKKNKSKKHKFIEQSFDTEQQVVQKSSLPDPESVKSNLSSLKENIFFKKYVKQDKSNDQNVIDKDNEPPEVFKASEVVEMPNTYKYDEDPSLIPTPKFKMQLPTTTTTYTKVKKKETTDSVPYCWDNNRVLSTNHELMRTQPSNNNETNNTEHTFPTMYDNSKGYFIPPPSAHPVSENTMNNMEFQQKQSYLSPNNKQRSRSRSASKRRINYSRSRSSGGRSSQSPFKKKPKETSKSKTRSRSGSYPRHRRYSSSRSNRSRSSSRSYSRSRSRSRSIHHRNRNPYYNNRNRGTYYKPRFQNQNHHNRGFQNRGFQHRGGYVHRQNYNNYNNNWNNRGQRGGGRQRFFHYRPRQYDRNRHYDRRSYSGSPNRRSRSRSKSRSGSKNSSKEYRKRYSGGSGEDPQHIANNKPKTPPEPTTESNKWQLENNDNGNRNSQDHDEGSIE
ncbi:PREDICTED: tetratricopeptide repeat protein 14 homolog isoform X1 [Diuraphis noxia]|uniref:tetratricopeptide repeat protein 14 homolog isoform X1 n=1 Tax=Diuraphis noxia TaxID=143948 RepID=UPI00076393AA|nr:PREDICTED: tetratricopeptide repeat protein 14 homolog isoform X1 [Diuraphis noxia]XP_015371461.1 PREDICTED: tetratricopeptide repeat protein 14 homolog isoform X1 [Diuraphis noxia]